MRALLSRSLQLAVGLLLTVATAFVQYEHGEYALYGNVGPAYEHYHPRMVAGWPAPYLADSTATSVPYKVGLEDDVRWGAFLGSLSCWLLVVIAASRVLRRGRGAVATR